MARQRRELVVGVLRRPPGERRFQQTLSDKVGKPAVRRRGMCVVFHGQPEVPLGWLARYLEHILARAQQLDDGERKVGKAHRVKITALGQESVQRSGIRRERQRVSRLGRQRDDPVPALGGTQHPAQRWQALLVEISCGYAVGRNHEILDQFLRPVFLVRQKISQRTIVEYRPHFQRFQSQRTTGVAHPFQRLRDSILDTKLFIQSVHRRKL